MKTYDLDASFPAVRFAISVGDICWTDVGPMLRQCWGNIVPVFGHCWDNVGLMFCWQYRAFSLRERALLAKNNRKLEKKYKESVLQVEEERRHADQYKEQVGWTFSVFYLVW